MELDREDRAKLELVIRALGSAIGTMLLTGHGSCFAKLPRQRREAILQAWSASALPLKRAGFQALKRLIHVAHYCWPGPTGRHPAWDHTGYPGPLPPPQQGTTRLAEPTVDRDMTLECDVVVVGSGAGGGVVAGVLAESGRDVIVLERGLNAGSEDMTQIEGDMLGALYLRGGLLMSQNGSMPILAGGCVGGGTVINYTTSLPLPAATRAEWDERAGIHLFTTARFGESVERVSRRLDVGTRWTTPGTRDRILERGCRALGWHVATIPRNVTECREGTECGFCAYGCRHGAKNSTARTYLADAVDRGARLVSRCDVRAIMIEGERAVGVRAVVHRDGHAYAVTVRARRVVIACGAVYTPAVLARSGVTNRMVGRNLYLHPSTALMGIFAERVEPWTGALQTRYSEHMADLSGGYGVRFETAPIHLALVASGFGWESARAHRLDVAALAHTGLVGVLLRDRRPGRVAVTRNGRPKVHYEVSRLDAAHTRAGLLAAGRILHAAGAERLVSLHTPPARVATAATSWERDLTSSMDASGYRRCRMSYISFHQMGTAAMGANRQAVVDERGEVHGVRGLFVADASTFPASSGVNPMLTIMAIADHVARGIQDAW